MSLLQPYLPGGTHLEPPDLIVEGDNQEYEIKSSVLHKKTRGRLLYQIKWKGYDATENSWLREEDLVNALE